MEDRPEEPDQIPQIPQTPQTPQTEEPSVSVHLDIAADPARVWVWLTTGDGLAAWMGDGAALDPRPGGQLSFPDPVGGRPRHGRVTAIVDQERLDYTWWPADRPTQRSAVFVTLEPIETGTRVHVTETVVSAPPVGFATGSAPAGRRSSVAGGSRSLIGAWSWRLALVTMATAMVGV